MVLRRFFLLICFFTSLAGAVALVPLPALKIPSPVAALEANQGQAKPEILFLASGAPSFAVTAQAIFFSPTGAQQRFVASNPNPTLRLSDPLPGLANSYTGSDPSKWVIGIRRYSTARLTGIYPGVDAEYSMSSAGLKLRLILQAGIDPKSVVFEVPTATQIQMFSDSSGLIVNLGTRADPALYYAAPAAVELTNSGQVARSVSFQVLSSTRFGLRLDGQTSTDPIQIEMPLGTPLAPFSSPLSATDGAGNIFVAVNVPDAAGKDDPFPSDRWSGCGSLATSLMACFDTAVYKFSKTGELMFVTYLAGRTRELPTFLGLASNGTLVVTGITDSTDFPVSAAALQRVYGGPPAPPFLGGPFAGDFFASRIDQNSGILLQSTYLGGPNGDTAGESALAADGSVYFLPKLFTNSSAGMAVTPGALLQACNGTPCVNGYVARLAPQMDKLIYATYLPGSVDATARLGPDGSVYYAASSNGDFPATPGAYQTKPVGGYDGFVARMDPTGTKLLFGTYIGGPTSDVILHIAVAPDGSVWAAVDSFVECCVDIQNRLVHFDATGQHLLGQAPFGADEMLVDPSGNLILLTDGSFTISPNALQAAPCGTPFAYLKISPTGQTLYATYLPKGPSITSLSSRGLPILQFNNQSFEIDDSQPNGVFAGCIADGASFSGIDIFSPGEIITIFGSGLGPAKGIPFQLDNGRVPTTLGGTRVLVNGQPAPLLYSSYGQVNAILPFSLPVVQFGSPATIQVEVNGIAGNALPAGFTIAASNMTLFQSNGFAAALNEDGTVNSPSNPAKGGSRVVLFGTGGGQTNPPSTAGEVTPLALRPLLISQEVAVPTSGLLFPIEFQGAAPGLVAGVVQINVKLPDVIPTVPGSPAGVLPIVVRATQPNTVNLAVK